jgi:hypothetical protein
VAALGNLLSQDFLLDHVAMNVTQPLRAITMPSNTC